MKKISIIIPAYNEEDSLPFLFERLNNLINQISNYEFEILFVNDGSKDKTLEIIKEQRKIDSFNHMYEFYQGRKWKTIVFNIIDEVVTNNKKSNIIT